MISTIEYLTQIDTLINSVFDLLKLAPEKKNKLIKQFKAKYFIDCLVALQKQVSKNQTNKDSKITFSSEKQLEDYLKNNVSKLDPDTVEEILINQAEQLITGISKCIKEVGNQNLIEAYNTIIRDGP